MQLIRPHLFALTLTTVLLAACATQPPADSGSAPIDTRAEHLPRRSFDWQPVINSVAADTQTGKARVQTTPDNALQITLEDQAAFGSDSATPTASFVELLGRISALLRQHPSLIVRIVGHTDSNGREGYNMQLSRARAKAVLAVLIDEGKIDPVRLNAEGRGEAEPIADNGTPEGRARNRRVELFLTPFP
ncbi:MAG TPA: OmpA family protein [Denitromonas sp.]|uniref:OmpA family protein n=1 Tax=Denitromonas sp. TaxID=2734609 RepID=UPI001DCC048D|nr:OmpA family protein [Rhodocyclaceae bacterium]MCP5221734.1 OmpA family protein [Zoogloeaceae bacterium]HPR05710.1 OmpA family protein [Denitromonas sp.]HQU87960.1 OmpA family protein [Denitromonas sp.]HQV16000.1 OmpA family protein [Denitromonas sp.]